MPSFPFKLCADDYALSPAVSAGILEALVAGRLSATSVMANRPDWPRAASELVRTAPGAEIGLHLGEEFGGNAGLLHANDDGFGRGQVAHVHARLLRGPGAGDRLVAIVDERGGFERGDGVGEACEVGGEDGGENLGHGRFMLAPEAASEMD